MLSQGLVVSIVLCHCKHFCIHAMNWSDLINSLAKKAIFRWLAVQDRHSCASIVQVKWRWTAEDRVWIAYVCVAVGEGVEKKKLVKVQLCSWIRDLPLFFGVLFPVTSCSLCLPFNRRQTKIPQTPYKPESWAIFQLDQFFDLFQHKHLWW